MFKKIFEPKRVLLYLMVIAIILVIVVALVPNNDSVELSNEINYEYNEGWILENTGAQITLPYYYKTTSNESVTISRVFDSNVVNKINTSISFLTLWQSVEIKIDGEQIYSYCLSPNNYFKGAPPPAWHIKRLTPDMYGKIISITFNSPLYDYSGVLNPISLGTKYANVIVFISSNALGLALCTIIIVFGAFVLTIYVFSRKKIPDMQYTFYLGTFSVLIGLWSLYETRVAQIVIGNVQFNMYLAYICFMLAPIALLLHFRSGKVMVKAYTVMIWVFISYFLLRVVLQLLNVTGIYEAPPVFFILIGITILLILLSNIRQYCRQKSTSNLLTLIAVIILLGLAVVDLTRVGLAKAALTSHLDNSLYFKIGLTIFILILGYSAVEQMTVYYRISNLATEYRKKAYTDKLSNLNNRTYLVDFYVRVFGDAIRKKSVFSIIMLDIDYFKEYNDNYGHVAGDRAIEVVAWALKKAVERSMDGTIRYGGEEFLVVLPNVPLEGTKHVAEKIARNIAEAKIIHEHSKCDDYLTVSQGIYSEIPRQNDTLEQFIAKADSAMYEAKRQGKNRIFAINNLGEIVK